MKINLVNMLSKEEIIEQTLRCQMFGEKCLFYLNGYEFYYDMNTDFIVLSRINKKIIKKYFIIPDYFDALGSNLFCDIANLIHLDASHIKKLEPGAIKNCFNLHSIDVSSCVYFSDNSMVRCSSLCKIKFNENIEYLGESFVDAQKCTFYFKNIKVVHFYAFQKIKNLRLFANNLGSTFFSYDCHLEVQHFEKIVSYKYYLNWKNRYLYYGGTLQELYDKLVYHEIKDLRFAEIVASDGIYKYER